MKFISIGYSMIILMIVVSFVNFYHWHQESVYEFDQRQMDLQVNYSVDAATQDMLIGSYSLETDYVDWGKMSITPAVAYDTFLALMLRNYGWNDTEENREALDSLVPFFVVCAYDGVYVLKTEKLYTDSVATEFSDQSQKDKGIFPASWAKNSGSSLILNTQVTYRKYWSPKIPYAEFHDGTCWLYYLGSRYGAKYDGTTVLNGVILDTDELKDQSKQAIANCVNSVVNEGLASGIQMPGSQNFFIPADDGKYSRTNSIKHPTCITYMQRQDQLIEFNTLTLAIGGAKIDEANFVVCYEKNGQKMYAMAKYRNDITSGGIKILKVLESPQKAAEEGYWFDLTYLE